MGEPVARLPPTVAPLRMRGEANWGRTASSSGTSPASRRSSSERVRAAPTSRWSGAWVRTRSSSRRSMPMTSGVRAPRRLTSTPQSVDPATSTASGCRPTRSRASARSAGRTYEPATPSTRVAAGSGAAACIRVATGSSGDGPPEGVGGIPDRPVPGAPAQVARDRLEVEAVGVGAVVLGGHRADETRGAVAALRPAAHGHLVLHGVQRLGRAEALGGDHLLAGEGAGGQQARVDRRPARAAGVVRPGHHDGAGSALALRAALLGAGEPLGAQPVQRVGPRFGAGEADDLAVDRHLRPGTGRHDAPRPRR